MEMICEAKHVGNCIEGISHHCSPHEIEEDCTTKIDGGSPTCRCRTVHCIPYPTPPAKPVEYELLKPISIKLLEEAGFPEQELHRFTFLYLQHHPNISKFFYAEILLGDLLVNAFQCEGGIQFLLDKGFIRVKEEALKVCPWCKETRDLVVRIDVVPPEVLYRVNCDSCRITGPPGRTPTEARLRYNDRNDR